MTHRADQVQGFEGDVPAAAPRSDSSTATASSASSSIGGNATPAMTGLERDRLERIGRFMHTEMGLDRLLAHVALYSFTGTAGSSAFVGYANPSWGNRPEPSGVPPPSSSSATTSASAPSSSQTTT